MKFISVRDFRNKSGQIQKQLRSEKEMVMTSNGKPIAILITTNEDNFEDSLNSIRQTRAALALKRTRLDAMKRGIDKLSLDDINQEINAVRRKRKSL